MQNTDRVSKWESTMAKPKECRECPYFQHLYVPPNLTPKSYDSKIVIVGEAPGREEQQRGEYFVGPSGQVLDQVLEEAGILRDDTTILNTIRCDPGGTSNVVYNPVAVEMCSKLLWKDLEDITPQVIVPMGNLALKAVLGKNGITSHRGKVTTLSTGTRVIPTFHPAYILRNPTMAAMVVADLDLVKKTVKGQSVLSTKNQDYQLFRSHNDVQEFFEQAHFIGKFSLDTETTSLDYREAEVICLSVSCGSRMARVLPFHRLPGMEKQEYFLQRHFLEELYDYLFGNPRTIVYMQNGKFDLRILNEFFQETIDKPVDPWKIRWYDTQNMGALLDEGLPHNLKDMARLHTDIVYETEELSLVHKGQITKMTEAQLVAYSGRDADATFRLGELFRTQLTNQDMLHLLVGRDYSDMTVLKCLYEMELFGAPLSRKRMADMRSLIDKKLKDLYLAMTKYTLKEFNPGSHPQIRQILFEDLALPKTGKLTGKGMQSTDKESLDDLIVKTGHEFPKLLRLYRQYSVILATFVEGAEKRIAESRLHPHFLSARTVSGRIVCVNPNIANIPKSKEFEEGILLSVRELYQARPGWIIAYADWSQQEFKVAALISGDARLTHELFEQGEDFHTLTARALFPQFDKLKVAEKSLLKSLQDDPSPKAQQHLRSKLTSVQLKIKTLRSDAKVFNFGNLYGGTDAGLASLMGISLEEVQALSSRRKQAYPALSRFIELTPAIALRDKELIQPFGRKRRFPYSYSEQVRNSQGRQGTNFIPQSGAAYIGRGALARICRRLKKADMQAFPFNIVYDSILVETPIDELYTVISMMTEEMTRPVPQLDDYSFSIDCGVGKTWKEAEEKAVRVRTGLLNEDDIVSTMPYIQDVLRKVNYGF